MLFRDEIFADHGDHHVAAPEGEGADEEIHFKQPEVKAETLFLFHIKLLFLIILSPHSISLAIK